MIELYWYLIISQNFLKSISDRYFLKSISCKIFYLLERSGDNMRKIESFEDLFHRISNHTLNPILKLVYKKHEENHKKGLKTISHVTYYKIGNVGDTVLSQCVRKTLQQLCEIESYDLIEVNEPVTNKVIEKINESEFLIIGGGGLFLPDTNENPISGWQWAISEENLNKIQVPIVIYAVGYNYFRGQEHDSFFDKNLKLIIKDSNFVGLRNHGSCRVIRDILSDDIEFQSKIRYQPCPTTLIRYIYSDIPDKKETKNIALNIAFDRIELRLGNDKDLILSEISSAMLELEKKGYKIIYVAHCNIDMKFIPYLNQAGVHYKKYNISEWFPKKVIEFYNNMDLVFGMRGHAQMIPFGLNCEIISLGSHDKMRWFLEDIDALDWYIELTKAPISLKKEIVEKFLLVHEKESEKTKNRLLEAQDKLWSISVENAKEIKNLMKN